jgi:hypothetical protein
VVRKALIFSLLTLFTLGALPQEAEAQRRAVRRSSPRRVAFVAARPYYPVYYSPFYSRWYGWYGWPGWYPYGFYGPYYPPYRYRYDHTGAARIEVEPREAEVYLDGYLVGRVDDFDGWLQRLRVPYGAHEVEIYLPGHRTLRENVLFRPGATVRIAGALGPLPPGTPDEPRPSPAPGSRAPLPDGYDRDPRMERGAPRGRPSENAGSVAIRVQPSDAEVLIDGERWDSPEEGERLLVMLSEGEHRIELRRDGYQPFETTIRIRQGETLPLNVSLTRQ